MRPLDIIFKLLLFPFYFLIPLALSKKPYKSIQKKEGKHATLTQIFLLIFFILFTSLSADNNSINGNCPGEIIEEIDGTTTDASHTEDGRIGGGGNDRYRIRFTVAGTLDISAVNREASRNENYRFYISDTNCGDWNVVNGDFGKSHSATVLVDAGDTITIRLQSDGSEPNNGRHGYSLSLDFTVTTTCNGCDCSLDTSANNFAPGVTIPDLHGATGDVSKCISGYTDDAQGNPEKLDYYYFRVDTDGTLDITTSSPNSHQYHLIVGSSADGTQYYGESTAESHNISTITLSSGDTVYLRIRETGSDLDEYEINFNFTETLTPTCTLIRDETLSLGSPVYNEYNNNGNNWNVRRPGHGETERFFKFTIDDPGDVEVTLSDIDHNQARFTVSASPCPSSDGGLTNTTVNFSAPGVLYVRVYFVDTAGNNSIEYRLRAELIPVIAINANDDSFTTPANTNLTTVNTLTNDAGAGITVIANTQPSDGSVVMQVDGSFVYTPPINFVGVTTFTYTIEDSASNTDTATVSINVATIPINAVDDAYATAPGIAINNNLFVNDTGTGITLTANTNPSKGTLVVTSNGDFTYTPDNNVTGTDTFDYTITDSSGSTDTATVTIVIDTNFTEGNYLDFTLINPTDTRNVIGDYKIAGNTVLCLTEKTSGYGGTCIDDEDHTSNQRVSKYLDIDTNGGTWNSTSSYINFDAPYNPTRGIIWAGLFWGGRISSDDNRPIRYAVENGPAAFSTIEVGDGGNVGAIDITTTGATNIKLKIDSANYIDILSSKFHVSPSSGGETYAAFADVSSILQSANLGLGKHTFTVANLTTMEGRENSPGAFGGWSLVVIYAEDYTNGKPRNISIYNGFIDIGTNNDPIEISGFKLPTGGAVQAQLSVFSGEGEYLYGKNPNNNNSDWMKISNQEGSGYDYMPGKTAGTHLGNRDNMFDAQLDNILRDNVTGEYNDLSNNNVGVDVDTYDVSDLMTGYRDNDENISSIYIQMYSDNDYITPSMMAFSAELYVPELCYDYTLDIDGHVLDSVNNKIQTPFGDFGEDLTTVIYLKSLEGDIPLNNISANYRVLDTSHLTYKNCSTEISETGKYDYSDACPYTYDATNNGFSMYAGKWKTTSSGGVIDAFENRYIKFDSEFQRSDVDTSFEFSVDYTVNYGGGAVPLRKIFTQDDLCESINEGFLPQLGYFNVTDSTNDHDEWNLYTQISDRAFNLKLYAYDANNPTHLINNDLNLSVEIEMIRADNFQRDANTACEDEHSLLNDVARKFIHFDETRSIPFSYDNGEINLAYRSAALRVWYLTDVGGDGFLIDDHNCTRAGQEQCIALYNREYTGGGVCNNECRTNLSTGNCYDCLRTYYGRKVCSRDSFSIRPESFITEIHDSDQNTDIRLPSNLIGDSTVTINPFSLIAGYDYRFDINATNHNNDIATPRYRQHFDPGSTENRVEMQWFPDPDGDGQPVVTGCNDVDDKNISLNIFNGSSINFSSFQSYIQKVDQIGEYRFRIFDQNWTSVDWDNAQMLHHTGASASFYKTGDDCIYDNSSVSAEEFPTTIAKQGCLINSMHTNANTGTAYTYLFARYYPYTFNTSGLSIGAGPTNDKTFVYINTLNETLYPNNIDENMSFNIQGTFFAEGYAGNVVNNFVDNCYAENVDMILQHAYLSDIPNNTANFTSDLIDYNTTDPSLTYPSDDDALDRNQNTFARAYTKDVTTGITITQNRNVFAQDMNGSITMDLGFNFDRTNNQELNPRRINFRDFNISYSTQPAPVFVDLITNYQIFGNRNIDQNITFLYARAKPGKTFYDDITANDINTSVSVIVYCDINYTECQNRGISAFFAQTSDANWWKSWNHDNIASSDGNIELISAPTSALNITAANIISKGEDKTVNVSRGASAPPVTIPINLVEVADNPLNYTDRWLIYNPESPNVAPSIFYRVRFIGGSGWAGYGDTGHVVGGRSNVQKNRRLEW